MSGPPKTRLLSDAVVREARRRHRHNPITYSVANLARRYGVPVEWLEAEFSRIEAHDALSNVRRAEAAAAAREELARPVEEARRALAERLRALEAADARDLTGRLLGDPVFERSSLYRKQNGQQTTRRDGDG